MLCEMHVHSEAALKCRRLRTAEEAGRARRRRERAAARQRTGNAAACRQRIPYGLGIDRDRQFHSKVLLLGIVYVFYQAANYARNPRSFV
jgi:hypothetical protein